MIIAIASLKKLSLQDRKTVKYQLSKSDIKINIQKSDMSMHTIAFNCFTKELYEDSMKRLSKPNVKWVSAKKFVKIIQSGLYVQMLLNFQKEESKEFIQYAKVAPRIANANSEAIKEHVEVKPMLRADLKKLKIPDLKLHCKRLKISQTGNKQQLIDKIVEKMREAEQF